MEGGLRHASAAPEGRWARWQFVAGWVVAGIVIVVNAQLFLLTDWTMLTATPGADWQIFVEASHRLDIGGDLYAVEADYAFRYSPVVAWLFGFIHHVGPTIWRLGHIGVLLLVPGRLMALVAVASWPFWFDLAAGNLMTFIFVAAAAGLAGRAWGIGLTLAFAVLVPRPLMLPSVAWFLWHHKGWRLPFVVLFIVHTAVVAASGWGGEWISSLLASSSEIGSALNFGPSRWIGALWLPIGFVIGAYLLLRGWVGSACLVVSPYWLPYYLIMPILDLERWRRRLWDSRRPHGASASPRA